MSIVANYMHACFIVTEEKPQSDSDSVNFKIVAQIEDVTVILSSMGRHVGKVDVEGSSCLLKYVHNCRLCFSISWFSLVL